jgi:hypothetical protein
MNRSPRLDVDVVHPPVVAAMTDGVSSEIERVPVGPTFAAMNFTTILFGTNPTVTRGSTQNRCEIGN